MQYCLETLPLTPSILSSVAPHTDRHTVDIVFTYGIGNFSIISLTITAPLCWTKLEISKYLKSSNQFLCYVKLYNFTMQLYVQMSKI